MKCPNCGLGGMKDDSCTHMFCDACLTEWCYFCGKSEQEVDKKNGVEGSIYRHNEDWQTKPDKRCPMYLTDIWLLDRRWSLDETVCLNKFHRIKTIESLRKFVNEISEQKYIELVKVFPQCGEPCGFSLKEIMNEDIEMIKRKNEMNNEIIKKDKEKSCNIF